MEVLYPAVNLTGSVTDDDVSLSWNIPATSGGLSRSLSGYKIYRNNTEIAQVPTNQYNDLNLANGIYDYYVKANYTSGLSEASNTVTPLVEVLYPATNLTYSVNQDEVTLNWDGAVNSGGLTRSFLGYKVYRDDVEIAEVTTLTYTDIDLSNGTYDYYVKADYTTGVSTPSNTVTAVIEVLYPATNLTYSVDQDEVTLVWDAAAINSGLNRSFLGYKVYRDNIEIADIMQTTYTDVDLTNGIYQYYVVANYSTGMSAPTSTVNALVEVLYPATNLTYSVDQDNVTLNWDAAAISGGLTRSFLGYKLYRDDVEIADQMTTSYLDAGLSNGIYNYYVKANYSTGISTPTATVSVLVEVLYPAANLTYSVDQDEVTLNWDAAAISGGLTRAFLGYKIYRDNVEIADIMQTTYTDVDLANGFYDYYIVAYYTNGMATPTNTVTAFVEVLYPATNLTYLVNQDEVTLNWDAAATSGGLDRAFLGYKVYRDDVEIADQMELTFTDVDLTNGTYTYYVKANYTSGLSEASNTVTPLVEVLYPATNLTYSVNQDEVTLSWDAAVTNGGLTRAFMGYKVYRNDVEIADLMELTYTDVDLTNGNYNYYVKANYSMGISAPTNTVNVLVEVLYPATNLTYSVDQDEVTLNWDAAATNGGLTRSFLGYKVYRDDVEIADIMATTFTDVDLTNGVYSYYVKANYTTGLSEASNTVTPLVEVLYPATNLTYSVDQDVVTLNWDAAVISGGLTRAFLGYKVYRDDVEIADVLDLTYTDANLTNGVYNYYVKAGYSTGMSTPTNTVNVLVEVLYPATNLTYSVVQDDVTLNWDAVAISGGLDRAFLGYKIYRNDIEIADIMQTTYTDFDLANGTYSYYVKANYTMGMSEPTNTVTMLVELLYPASNLTYSVDQDMVSLAWDTAPINGGITRDFLGYNVFRNNVEIATVTETSYDDVDLTNGVYSYYVVAEYSTGNSTPTNTVTAIIEVLYPAMNLTYNVNADQVVLSWDPAALSGGLTRSFLGYKVYRDDMEIADVTTTSYSDNGLANGSYDYYIRAEYTSGIAAPSNTVTAIVEVLYPARNLTASVSNDIVTLNWDAPVTVGGLTRSLLRYKIYRDFAEIAEVTTTTFDDSGLANGTYNYYVKAVYTSGLSAASNSIDVTVEVLYPATGLTAVVQSDDVRLNWVAPTTSNLRTLMGYKVYRNSVQIAQLTGITYLDSNLANGTYDYSIVAYYNTGDAIASNIATVTVEVTYAPTNLTASVIDDVVTLNWTAPVISGGLTRSFNGYFIYRNGDLEHVINNPSVVSYDDANLANGTYEYYIVAVYDAGISAHSNTVQAIVNVLPDLFPPTDLVAVITNLRDVNLSWTAPAGAPIAYRIYRDAAQIAEVAVTTYDDLNLANGSYTYWVKAVYNEGVSSNSNSVDVNIEIAYAPQNLVSSVDYNDVTLNWDAPTAGETGYLVYRDNVEIALINNPLVLSYTDLDLTNGTYEYFVKAIYSTTISSASNMVSATVEIIYPAGNLTVLVTGSDAQLDWTEPIDVVGLIEYKIYKAGVYYASTTDLTYTDSNLANGSYQYYVTAMYGTGESVPTSTVTAVIGVIYPVQNVVAVATANSVDVSWDAPADLGGLLTYRVRRDGVLLEAVTTLTYNDSPLPNGTYTYSVIAHYSFGDATSIEATPVNVLQAYAPSGLTAQSNGMSVELNWNQPTDIGGLTGYNIYKDGSFYDFSSTNSYDDANQVNGTYSYYVTALYGTLESSASNTVNSTVQVTYAPSNLTFTINDNEVSLDWSAPVDLGGFVNYNIYRDGSSIATTTTTQYIDMNLANDVYNYYVTAVYSFGESAPSNPINPAIQVTYIPSNLLTQVNDADVQLSWTAAADLGGFVSYRVYRDGSMIAEPTAVSFTDIDLANGSYDYSVTTMYLFGESEATSVVSATVEVAYAPETAEASVVPTSHFALVNWTAPADAGLLTGYKVYRLMDGEQTTPAVWTMVAEMVTELTYTDESFATLPDDDYLFAVIAEYASGALSEHTFTNLLNPTDNENNSQTPVKTALLGNYPNPFNPDTTINFALDANSDVVINIFNNKGQLVKTVLNKNMTTGQHSVVWNGIDKNGRTVPSGVYFIRMNSNGYSRTTKAVLMK
jgi:formaldehyde-activating enzyme involved in methanogenesis